MKLDWYFDFISPYAYLQFHRLEELPGAVELRLRPVLFAALLDHWGQLGPAEIAPKRLFTYRHVIWLARRHGIEFRMPPAHPFNPLSALRLAVALGASPAVVGRIFDYVWAEGADAGDPAGLLSLGESLGAEDPAALLADPATKAALRQNGEDAIAAGVFGVPSFAGEGVVLWGQDSLEIIRDWLEDPRLFSAAEAGRLEALPQSAVRPGSRR